MKQSFLRALPCLLIAGGLTLWWMNSRQPAGTGSPSPVGHQTPSRSGISGTPGSPPSEAVLSVGTCDPHDHVAADIHDPHAAGEPLSGDFLDRIVNGKSFAFTLPDGSQAEGTVETSDRDAQGIVRLHGRVTKPAAGTCFIQRQTIEGVAGPFVGHVLFDGKSEGWKIEPTEDRQSARFVQSDQNHIVCVKYQKDPQMELFIGPPQHPTDKPLPPYQDVIALQSMPAATGVIYLDFDGEKGPHSGWGNFDAAPAGRSNAEIFEIWRMVSEDFQGFNLNVTTDRKVFDAAPQGRRQKCIITPTTSGTPSGAAGVAYMGSFNWGGDTPCWAHYLSGAYAAHVISHEVGHTLGLSHDGIPEYGYYSGHGGTGPTSWGPIMGDGAARNLDTWSKGEYAGANNHEDDLAIIANNNNNVGFRADDTGDTLATASYLEIFPGNSVDSQGFIGTTGDVDAFRFRTSGGQATLNVNTVAAGPDLDILAEIVNSATGVVVASDNPDLGINASVSANLPSGEYLLRVRGTGRGDPLGDGYTNYASLGSYTISGSVAGGVYSDRLTVAENSSNGSAVGTIPARINHGANPLTWAIASGNTNNAFTINSANGNITVANTAALDFETLSLSWDDPATFEMFVTITDSANPSLNENIRVVVTVTDINETLAMSGANTTILEGLPVGTVVATALVTDPDHFDVPTYAITDGDPFGDFSINSRTGKISIANQVPLDATTTYNLTVTATDSGTPAFSTSATFNITVVNIPEGYQPGKLTRTFYENITGSTVADLTGNARFPDDPDSVQALTAFDGGGHGDNFGSSIRGYVIPTVSGTYQFWIASDDSSELRFNASGPAQGGTVIASVNGATGQYAWTTAASQQSTTFNLVAGQPYYIEARHKEGNGGDHVAVAWSGPGISRQVIPIVNLAPFDQNFAPRVPAATFQVYQTAPANHTLGTVAAMDANPGQSLYNYTITSGNDAGIFDIDPNTGRLFVTQDGLMNSTTNPTYSLGVSVSDDGDPSMTGSATITVQVLAVPFNFVWSNPAGGSWKTTANWQGGSYPNGSADVADLTTLDLSANTAVALDGAINIAALKARDTTASHDWTINPGSGGSLNLTDIGGAPYIDVANRSLFVTANLTGSQGLTKIGAGELVLQTNCGYTGATNVSAGTLHIGSANVGGSINDGSPVSIAAGAAVKWWNITDDVFGSLLEIPNPVSGSGQWILQGINDATNNLGVSAFQLNADNSGFTGELILNRVILNQVSTPSQTGSGLIRVQDNASAWFFDYTNVANAISIENGTGWHHEYGVFGAIHLSGSNSFIGNLQLNQTTGVVLGDGTGANCALNAWDNANASFTGNISGPGELSMSPYVGWNYSTVNIDISGTGSNTYTGKTVVNGHSNGSANLRLMKTTGAAAIPGGNVVQLGNATEGTANLRMGDSSATGAARNQWDNQFGTDLGGVRLDFVNDSGQWMRVDLQGANQTVAGLNAGNATTQAGAVIQNQHDFDPGQNATLTLIGGGSYLYNGYLRDQDDSGTTRKLNLVKSGIGTQTLAGSAITYTGTTTINAGTLLANGSVGNTATTVATDGTLGGTGSIAGAVSSNGTLAPGSNGVGNLTINNTATLAGGSKIAWEINNWTGAAGAGSDKLTANALNITATSANRITLKLADLSLVNFSEASRTFTLVQTTSGITGFSADKFIIDDSNVLRPQGTWAIQQSGNNLVLAYTGYTGSNIPPDFTADPILVSATEDAPISGAITATDGNVGDTLTYTKLTGPGWLNVASNGALSGTPANSNVGVNTFTVRVMDSAGAIDEAVLQVTVANTNDAPVFTVDPINLTLGEGQTISGNLSSSASDIDVGDTLTFSKISGPGWLNVAANGALSGMAGNAGAHGFTVRVQDAAGAFADATLNISVVSYDGVWINAAGGAWPLGSNWSGGNVAGGVGKTANFSTLDLAADATVTLDGPRSLGNLSFGDTSPSHNWTLNAGGGGPLALDVASGTPTITVNNQTTTLNLPLAGNKGLNKAGAGSLVLSGSNTYTGVTTVSQGILYLNGGAPTIPGNLTLNGPDATYVRMQQANQFGAGGVADFTTASGAWNRFELFGKNQALAGIKTGNATTLGGGVIQNSEVNGAAGANATLTLNGTGSYLFNGHLRDYGSPAAGTNPLSLVKSGIGTQTLVGDKITYSGSTTVNAGTLVITPLDADWTLTSVTKTVASGGTLKMDFSPQTTQYRQTNLNTTVVNAGGVLELYGTADNVNSHYLINSGWTATGAGTIRVTGGGSFANWTGASNTLSGFTGLLDIQNGRFAVNIDSSSTLGGTLDVNIAATGKLDLRSGHFTADALDGAAGSFVHKSYTGDTINFTIGNNHGSGNFAGVMQGTNYNVIKTGTGTQTLGGANTYAGTTTVNGGSLLVNGSLANGAVTVATAGTLGGTGSIAGTVSNSGTLAPGSNGIGNLTINNTATLAGGSKIAWEISNWTGSAGTGFDKLTANTLNITATSGNRITLKLAGLSLANFSETNKTFVIAQASSSITGFSADKFTIDASGLTTPHGTWAVQQSGNTLLLAYTAQTNPDSNNNGILDTWETARFGNANPGANPANGDPDKDGQSNLMEYALDTNPTTSGTSPITYDQETLGDGKHLRITVPKNAAATNLTYLVESCGALNDWSTANTTVETNTANQLIVRDNFTTTNAARRFIRLRVQSNP